MIIRRAEEKDLAGINSLLRQVLDVHQKGRPDIFKAGAKKYNDNEILEIVKDDSRPIFVAEDAGKVLGYAFCMFKQHQKSNILTNVKTLYIDDLCVDEGCRGKHIGKAIYEYVLGFAKAQNCYNVTLNVWTCNQGALKFYEKMGLLPQKIEMEKIL